MKDKFVRDVLVKAGIVKHVLNNVTLETSPKINELGKKLDAIMEYLNLEFEYVTPKLKVRKKCK